ncbi:exonuclease SbcCD subunit D C-terminal domain-containing protein [Psychrobacter sp. M13]|uniref:exonuclease SbcCD subunit D C-terminal domain-containing protein n=1 Tax=Psychrobacter sp. M13 TaxID=3067275 RepID=UPI00273AF765|nr:exonuclease SbcCD subunit D C-terminal domain-containing protein [Psychrobacter sp. M13]WLP95746.1 exonuclease SbcCD subunit D C-terminal domain-containing protein [Psychrobacter sp. M13]
MSAPSTKYSTVSALTDSKSLTILHTSDWHLGRRLYGRLRYEEFEAFLNWLQETISARQVDVLIVAGDIFDTMTPSNRAQALYYEFLGKVSTLCCQHIVIVAGNHDSPTFLDAPSQVLKFLNVHIIGTACDDLNDEVLMLDDNNGEPLCVIAAVPYLRDRDVRGSQAGESADSKDANVIAGIRSHYDSVAQIAKDNQRQLSKVHKRHIPIIATGHLFAAGSKTTEDDGVRELYVGNLGKISAEMFDECFDYVALGHLHVPQRVGGCEHIRYSGSPIAMGFGEARQQKQVLLIQFGTVENTFANAFTDKSLVENVVDEVIEIANVKVDKTVKKVFNKSNDLIDDLFGFDEVEDFDASIKEVSDPDPLVDEVKNNTTLYNSSTTVETLHSNNDTGMQVATLAIPCFQQLAQVSGDLQTIATTILAMASNDINSDESIWLEIIYNGDEIVSELREEVSAMVEGLPFEVLKIKNTRTYNKVLNQEQTSEALQDLNELEVFERCLTTHEIAETQRESLRDAYQQILHSIYHDDSQAE